MEEKNLSHITEKQQKCTNPCHMSSLMLVDSLGLDCGATRKMSVNALKLFHVNWVYGEAKNVNIF